MPRFFNTKSRVGRFGAEHIVASRSLPASFPATPVDGKFYWGDGCVSNSPLEAVLNVTPPGHTGAFVIDLYSAKGPVPDTMAAVAWRAKQIKCASNTPQYVDSLAVRINLRHALAFLQNPNAVRSDQRPDLVQIVYHPQADQIPASDAEFSRGSIAARWPTSMAPRRKTRTGPPSDQR